MTDSKDDGFVSESMEGCSHHECRVKKPISTDAQILHFSRLTAGQAMTMRQSLVLEWKLHTCMITTHKQDIRHSWTAW